MIYPTVQYWGDIPSLIDYVRRCYDIKGVLPADIPSRPVISINIQPPHMGFVEQHFTEVERWVCHVSIITSETVQSMDHMWVKGFPHVHNRGDKAKTMMTYLTSCIGGALMVAQDGFMRATIPRPGLCAFTDGETEHGIRPVTEGERLGVFVTGFQK